MNLNESHNATKKQQREQTMIQGQSIQHEVSIQQGGQKGRNKYGNMLVLLETNSILITLGPDYPCFIFTFIGFAVAGAYLIFSVNTAYDNPAIKALNILLVLVQLISYLLIAVSNPGIVLQQNLQSQQINEEVQRFCKVCRIIMQKGMYHCRDCGVCIRKFDHHCPWTSKCIGGGNLKRFYFFVTITPIYIMYYMVMILIAFATLSTKTVPKL